MRQVVLENASKNSIDNHLDKEADLHALSDYREVELVWSNCLNRSSLEKAILVLVVILESFVQVSQDSITGRSIKESATSIEATLPVLLHDSVHDVALHDLEGVQMLKIVQRVTIH